MRMRRRSDLADRAPLVKSMPLVDGHSSGTRGRPWYARLCLYLRRTPVATQRQPADGPLAHGHGLQHADNRTNDSIRAPDNDLTGQAFDDIENGTHKDSWRRAYASVYGVDPESGDPLDHAVLRRIGASWRFMWMCRRPIVDVPPSPGALVQGEWALPNGDLVRGAFHVCRLPLPLSDGNDRADTDARGDADDASSSSAARLSCARILCPISGNARWSNKADSSHCITKNGDGGDRITAEDIHGGDIASNSNDDINNADNEKGDVIRDVNHNGDAFDSTKAALALVPHGYAAAVGVDGSLVEGVFSMGLLDGHGRTVDSRGEIFGTWRRGRLHGRAVAVTQDGWFVCATWNDGRLAGNYFAHAAHGEQFRCKTCPDGRFDGRCRRGYPGGDWAIERWSDGTLVGIDCFRIAPVIDSDDLADGAMLDDCVWTCDRVRGGSGVRYDGHIYYPSDPASRAFALFYDYMASEASGRAFTDGQRDAFVWAMWMARRRAATAPIDLAA